MSRSLKRSPFFSHCGGQSDKWWKRFWHRRLRAASRAALHDFDGNAELLPHVREVSDVWASRKDWLMRFDPAEHPERMRK